MSERELRRAGVLAQVVGGSWTLVEAAERMELSYRQGKRLWKRYQADGAAGLVHGSVGRASNRATPKKLRAKVLRLIREKYAGEPGERFGPTLASEHLGSEDQITVAASTLRRGCSAKDCGAGKEKCERTAADGRASRISASGCRWMAVSMNGWSNAGREGV